MTHCDYLIVGACLLGAAMCARGMAGHYPAQDLRAALNAASWAMEFHPDTCLFAVTGMIVVLCAWASGERGK